MSTDPDYAQRRRIAVAVAVTAIAAPAAFLLDRGDDTPALPPGGTVIGTVEPAGDAAGAAQPGAAPSATHSDGAIATTPLGTAPPGYSPESTVIGQAEPVQVAVPLLPESLRGDATYSSAIDNTTECQARDVPFQAKLTVTNLANSRSVQCVFNVGGPEPEPLVVLSPSAFAELADPTDAPIAVEITWTT